MKQMLRKLSAQSRIAHFLILAAFILLYYQIHLGWSFINPFCFNWLLNDSELAVFFFGWDFYHAEPWTFPVGQIQNYFYPLGTNIYMTDIPLVALLLKPFAFILPGRFQYVGIWLLLGHLLQAWFAILLCERFEMRGVIRIVACLFIVFCPVFLIRFQHATLFAHWILLGCFYIYFMDSDKNAVKKIIMCQLILIVISALIMVYLWLIVFGFSAALLIRLWLVDKKIKYYHVFLLMTGQVLLVLLLWVSIGLISFGSLPDYQSNGWGDFSVNLNSFFNPFNTSALLPSLPYFPLQGIEGYAYLGAGMLLLILFSMGVILTTYISKLTPGTSYSRKSQLVPGINMVPLVVFMTAAFLFALSCNISFNQHVLFHYELKGFFLKMANSFRASGRFIWPIYYFILLIIFYHINKLNLKSALKNSVLVFCFVLQIIDLKGFFLPAHTKCDAYAPPISASWEKLIQSFDKIVFFPGFTRTYLTFDDYKYFTYYAGKYHKKINIGYLARFNMAEAISFTSRLNREITENGLDDRTLYITLPPYFNRLLLPIEDNKAHSLYLDGYYAIFKKIPVHAKLFDEIARTEGDKINHKIQWKPVELEKKVIDLIQKSNGIKTNVYEKDESEDHFYIKGWAFSEESSDNLHDSVTLILATRGKTYFSVPVYRFYTDDVAGFFKNPKLNRSGFGISFLKRSLREGNYSVGLLLTNSSNGYEALRWTDTDFTVLRKLAPIPVNGAPLNAAELRLSIETIRDNEKEIDLAGWAFPSSGICPSCKNFVFLSSPEKNYEVEFFSNPRPDVVTFFKNDTSLLYSGIKVGIQKSDLLPATYNVGVIMRDTIHNKEYFSLSDKLIKAGVSDFAQPTLLNEIPSGHDEIRAFIDTIEDYDSVVHITGWAFIDSLSTDLSHCTFALQSGDLLYEVAADRTYRVDLKSFFKLSYNTDWAGLSVRINKKDLSMGRYQLCVVMFNKSSGEKTIHCLDNYIEIPPHP